MIQSFAFTFDSRKISVFKSRASQIYFAGKLKKIYALSKGSISDIKVNDELIKNGSIVEFISLKGIKYVALVSNKEGAHLKVQNEARKFFSVPFTRVTYVIDGSYAFGDLLRLHEILQELKLHMLENIWEKLYFDNSYLRNISDISILAFGNAGPINLFITHRLMLIYGSTFFSTIYTNITMENEKCVMKSTPCVFQPLPPHIVDENLKDRLALRELKIRINKVLNNKDTRKKISSMILTDIPDRIQKSISKYEEGLKQIICKSHPWVTSGIARIKFNETLIAKSSDFLQFLELAPIPVNARNILNIVGRWPMHMNIEKYIMEIRDHFPRDVLEESDYLINNYNLIPDPDERLRRDLRHLGTENIRLC